MREEKKCANCNKSVELPHSLCWECEKPICRDCGGKGNAGSILRGTGFLNKDKALVCKKCYK